MQEAEVDDTDVNPEHDWCEPPLCVLWLPSAENSERLISLLQPHGPYGCGEASQERQEREAYRHLHPYQHFGPGEDLSMTLPEYDAALCKRA